MMLWEEFLTECKIQKKTSVSDGQGGFTTSWTDNVTFNAAIVKNTSTAAQIAEKQGITAMYTITIPTSITLNFHDIFKRISDNKIFRVTSNYTDSKPPKSASFAFYQVTAEEWELP